MLLKLILLGLVVGCLGTGIGAISILPLGKKTKGNFLFGFSAGFMICIVLFDMIPSSLQISDLWAFLSILLGAVFVGVVGIGLDKIYIKKKKVRANNTGILLFCAIALHNLPEGVAIGAGSLIETRYAIFLSLVMIAHNIPEGMAMGISLYETKVKPRRILLYGLVAGIPTCIGVVLGNIVAHINEAFIGGGIGFAAGAMLYVCLQELIPKGKGYCGNFFYITFIIGGVFGQIVLLLCKFLI